LEGILDKVTIGFKPLGVNPFIESTFMDAFSQHSQVFTGWEKDASFAHFLQAFFQEGVNANRVGILEKYLLSRFRPLPEETLLQNVLEQLTHFDEECRIDAIVKSIGMNTRTFNRLFYKNLGISPIGYRKVARFRHSLRNKLFNKQFEKLTGIGYESNYNDQSYFIKMYQKIAGSSPARFFNAVEKLADNQLIFKFISHKE
jgi:AraC-like DNA-binding protein